MTPFEKTIAILAACFLVAACNEDFAYYDEIDRTVEVDPDSSSQTSTDWNDDVSQISPFRGTIRNARSSDGVPNAPFSRSPNSRFGVCNRYTDQAFKAVNARANASVQEVRRQNLPPHIVNAHMTIIRDAHSRGTSEARGAFDECVNGFRKPQEIVDIATLGFSSVMRRAGIPEGRVRIDASEITSGRPFGGNEAFVPKAREQVLGNDRGTGANIVRDPIRCITFMRKC